MLSTQQLRYSYDQQRWLDFPDLHCSAGEQWLILGQSGSGKSTLLHLLGGLLKTQEGEIRIQGQALRGLSGAALDRFRGQHIGIVFQKAHFVRALSVLENLQITSRLAGRAWDKGQALQLLERLGIAHKAQAKPHRLSQGEQQRAAIARALITRPAIVLADEPTSALDDRNTAQVVQLLEEQAAAHAATLLIVTHDTRLKSHFTKRIEL